MSNKFIIMLICICYENINDEVKERKVRERVFYIYVFLLQCTLFIGRYMSIEMG